MPRPLLKPQHENQLLNTDLLSTTVSKGQKQQTGSTEKLKIDRVLRQKRSKKYMDAMTKLDAGGHVSNQSKVKEIINAIQNEFPELEFSGQLLGVVAKCYLGDPYEVHTLAMNAEFNDGILEHYKRGECLPGMLEKARGIAKHGGYSFIEVYPDCCRAVDELGNVSVIPF